MTAKPPSREGKRVLSVYLTPEAWKQLRMLSLDLGSSTQALGEEAVNLLFEKHRLNRVRLDLRGEVKRLEVRVRKLEGGNR